MKSLIFITSLLSLSVNAQNLGFDEHYTKEGKAIFIEVQQGQVPDNPYGVINVEKYYSENFADIVRDKRIDAFLVTKNKLIFNPFADHVTDIELRDGYWVSATEIREQLLYFSETAPKLISIPIEQIQHIEFNHSEVLTVQELKTYRELSHSDGLTNASLEEGIEGSNGTSSGW